MKPTNSSTYPPNQCFNTLFPDKNRFEVVEILKLSSTTLDQLDIKNADFIKLDIQGGTQRLEGWKIYFQIFLDWRLKLSSKKFTKTTLIQRCKFFYEKT